MEAITIYRLFESSGRILREQTKQRFTNKKEAHDSTPETTPVIEKRYNPVRRQSDRRSGQSSVMLNTRKTQGRRSGGGRRAEDRGESDAPKRISIIV